MAGRNLLVPTERTLLCLVCGDVSSGLHYGIHTCESCKSFFKRSVQRENQGQVVSACRNGDDCAVTWENKAGCQACRFAKCLAAGMRRDAVRVNHPYDGRRRLPPPLPGLGTFSVEDLVKFVNNANLPLPPNLTTSPAVTEENMTNVSTTAVVSTTLDDSEQQPAPQPCEESSEELKYVPVESKMSSDSAQENEDVTSPIIKMEIKEETINCGESTLSGRPDPVLCLVCGDVSSGLHYGVRTCESCKAFFKRSVQREKQGQAPVKCRSSGNCPVTWQKKAGCQACRFVKCLAAGMKRDNVRVDHTPSRPQGKRGPPVDLGSISIEELLRIVNSQAVPATSLVKEGETMTGTASPVVVKEEPTAVDSVEETSSRTLDDSSLQLDTQLSEESSHKFEYVSVKSEITDDSAQDNGDLGCPTLREVLLGGAVAPSQGALLCLVCGDISSGLHYGIHTCESCKAFFKRSVQRENQGQALSACRSGGDCPVTWQRKAGCQACRFAKCLAAGMRRDVVRTDQTRGGRRSAPTTFSFDELVAKYRRLQDSQSCSAQEDPLALGS